MRRREYRVVARLWDEPATVFRSTDLDAANRELIEWQKDHPEARVEFREFTSWSEVAA